VSSFSCFALPDSFSAVLRALCPVFMFCVPGPRFGGTKGVGSRFLILRSRKRFRRYRGRRIPFSCFARPNLFSAVPMASGPVFIFCAPGHVFGGIEGVGSRFHVLRSRTSFRLYRGRSVPFTCFARPYSFSAVPKASAPDFIFCTPTLIFCGTDRSLFIFCAPRLIFGGTEGVGSRFHVLCSQTLF
jgi:hypothetical protein